MRNVSNFMFNSHTSEHPKLCDSFGTVWILKSALMLFCQLVWLPLEFRIRLKLTFFTCSVLRKNTPACLTTTSHYPQCAPFRLVAESQYKTVMGYHAYFSLASNGALSSAQNKCPPPNVPYYMCLMNMP